MYFLANEKRQPIMITFAILAIIGTAIILLSVILMASLTSLFLMIS